jgi:hypothetical protein
MTINLQNAYNHVIKISMLLFVIILLNTMISFYIDLHYLNYLNTLFFTTVLYFVFTPEKYIEYLLIMIFIMFIINLITLLLFLIIIFNFFFIIPPKP